MIIYSAFADAGLAVRAVIAGAEGVLPKATAPRALLDALRDGADAELDNRALRALGERLDAADLPILGMLAHGVGPREIAVDARARAGVARGAPLGDARRGSRRRAAASPRGRVSAACDNTRMPTRDQILEALKVVIDPELHRNIVELGMVRNIDISEQGAVNVTVSLTTPGCPIKGHFQNGVTNAVKSVEGVTAVSVGFDVLTDQEKQGLQRTLGRPRACPRARSPRSPTSSASAPARAASASRR